MAATADTSATPAATRTPMAIALTKALCAAATSSPPGAPPTSIDVVADGTAAWVAMHGTVTLRTALPGFPWPDPDGFVRQFALSLARVRT